MGGLTLQELPPAQARLCLDAERFLREQAALEPEGLSVAAAVSGGSDSTALAVVLHCLAARLDLKLTLVHVDHGLREDSRLDRQAAEALAQRLGRPFLDERIDVAGYAQERGVGVEEAGRILRYQALERARVQSGADLAALGHHLDDQAEDVLMRLMRGAGWPGLAGMDAFDPDRRIARPLLFATKSRLQEFLRETGVSWREDPSNRDRGFLRNRVRLDVVPRILEENPNFPQAMGRLAALGRIERDFESHLAEGRLQERESGLFLDGRELAALHPALRLRLYKRALDRLGPGQTLLDNLLNLDAAATGAVVQFPGGKTAEVTREGVRFWKTGDEERG